MVKLDNHSSLPSLYSYTESDALTAVMHHGAIESGTRVHKCELYAVTIFKALQMWYKVYVCPILGRTS